MQARCGRGRPGRRPAASDGAPAACADGALLVYDITHKDSFTRVKHWVKELRSIVGPHIAIAIAGNKVDLEKQRAVSQADAVACVAAPPRGGLPDRLRSRRP